MHIATLYIRISPSHISSKKTTEKFIIYSLSIKTTFRYCPGRWQQYPLFDLKGVECIKKALHYSQLHSNRQKFSLWDLVISYNSYSILESKFTIETCNSSFLYFQLELLSLLTLEGLAISDSCSCNTEAHGKPDMYTPALGHAAFQ